MCDLAEPGAPESLAREAGAVDVLIANAALPASGPIGSFSVAEIDRALAVNLRAPMVLGRLLGEAMAARGAGHMVFMSSLSGKAASVGTSVYSATKFGLRGFALGLREDLAPAGVGVSCVFPGFVRDAGMFADTGASLPPYVGTSTAQQVVDGVLRAIEHDRAEVDVAPLPLRAGTMAADARPRPGGTGAAAPGRRRGVRRDHGHAARQALRPRPARRASTPPGRFPGPSSGGRVPGPDADHGAAPVLPRPDHGHLDAEREVLGGAGIAPVLGGEAGRRPDRPCRSRARRRAAIPNWSGSSWPSASTIAVE